MDSKKTCSKCLEELPHENFYKDKSKKHGLSSQCKMCVAENYKQKKDNPDFIKYNREKSKKYYEENKAKCLEWHKKNRSNNIERIKKQQADYRAANKQLISFKQKAYRDANKEKIRLQKTSYRKSEQYKYLQNQKREYMRLHSRLSYYRHREKYLASLRKETESISDKHIIKLLSQRNGIHRRLISNKLIQLKRHQLNVLRDTNKLIQAIKEKKK